MFWKNYKKTAEKYYSLYQREMQANAELEEENHLLKKANEDLQKIAEENINRYNSLLGTEKLLRDREKIYAESIKALTIANKYYKDRYESSKVKEVVNG